MRSTYVARVIAHALVAALAITSSAECEQQLPEGPHPIGRVSEVAHSVGYQGLFIAGYELPGSKGSFNAVGLGDKMLTLGGGAQLTNVWRSLFVQVNVTRFDETGERVFVSQSGDQVRLGIPLDVTAMFTDVGVGWRFAGGRGAVVPYGGGGLGAVNYKEQSPFGIAGEDFTRTALSYNVFGGVEFGLTGWAALGIEARYRHVPGVLGEGGVSDALDDNSLSGTTATVRLLLGPRGLPKSRRPEAERPRAQGAPAPTQPRDANAASTPPAPTVASPAQATGDRMATVTERSGIFIRPDAITPLRVVEPGTVLKVLQTGDVWLRVQFRDQQWGDRVGYILRGHCRLSAQ